MYNYLDQLIEKYGFTEITPENLYMNSLIQRTDLVKILATGELKAKINFRVNKAGGKIWFESEIALDYYVRSNYSGLMKQFYQYGYWKVFVNTKHKTVTTWRQLIPPVFVLYVFSIDFLPFLPFLFTLFYSLPFILYLILLVFVSLRCAKKSTSVFAFIRTFIILHFSYGSGYLHGILNFIILKRKPSKNQMRLSR